MRNNLNVRINTANEICLNAITTAYDTLNNKIFINRAEINRRFQVLKELCRSYAPSKIMIINRIYTIVMDNINGKIQDHQAFNMLQQIQMEINQDPNVLNIAALNINQANMNRPEVFQPFGIDMLFLLGEKTNQKNKLSKRKRSR